MASSCAPPSPNSESVMVDPIEAAARAIRHCVLATLESDTLAWDLTDGELAELARVAAPILREEGARAMQEAVASVIDADDITPGSYGHDLRKFASLGDWIKAGRVSAIRALCPAEIVKGIGQ